MPRQNRVTPFGEIIARPERGTFMGNRGRLHDPEGQIRRSWRLKAWLVCLLEFKGRKRTVMSPDRYTELFFLDEATAFAAGHRPCWECRRKAAVAFLKSSGYSRLPALDDQLHTERLNADKSKRTFQANLSELPDGVFVMVLEDHRAYLLWDEHLHPWSPRGYGDPVLPHDRRVVVLTPNTTVAAIRAGYLPQVHASAERVVRTL
jgi:hypothetical protein